MSDHSPPEKAQAALAKRRREKLIDVPRDYHAPLLVQSRIIWKRWEREAARLFSEFWRTADERHLTAFSAHVHAMRRHEGRPR
jgi:hypothetical protein